VSIDAVVSDFVSGSVEWLCPANDPDHWDLIEGQGSLFHASYAGVTLGLIHGAQPDALVMCHEPTRAHMRGLPGYKLPELQLCIERNVEAAIARCRQRNGCKLIVSTAASDTGNLRFYQRQGFRMYRIVRDAFGPATGYAAGTLVDGIPLRDQVFLELDPRR